MWEFVDVRKTERGADILLRCTECKVQTWTSTQVLILMAEENEKREDVDSLICLECKAKNLMGAKIILTTSEEDA